MATVIKKDDLHITRGVRVEDYDPAEYIINPIIPLRVPKKYLKIDGDTVVEMNAEEKTVKNAEIVEAATIAVATADRAAKIKAFVDAKNEAAAIAAEVIPA